MLKDFSRNYIALRRFPNGGPIDGEGDFVGPPMPYSLVTAGDIPLPDYNIFEDENSFKKRDAHLKSLDAFIAANPTIAGLNTADFRDVLSQFAGLESSYNPKASNKSGYSGYYGLEGGSSLSDNAQHRKAYEHLASLFKHNITRDDVQKGIDMGYTPAQVLYKYWNQQNNATEFLQNGSAETIGNNPELGLMGNNINAIADYYRYIPEAVTDDFHVVKSGDNFSTIQERVRKPGRHYNQAGKDLKQWNSDDIVNGKLRIGDKVWFTTPYAEGGFLKDYRSGGNLFWPGGEKNGLFNKERILNRVYGDGQGFTEGNSGIMSSVWEYLFNKDNAVDARIRDAEAGVEKYKDILKSGDPNLVYNTFKNLSKEEQRLFELGRMADVIKQHEDAKRIYLGYGPKYGYVEESQYKPTIGKSENPYQINPLMTDGEFNNLILPLWSQWKTGIGANIPIAEGYSKRPEMKPRVEDKGNVALVRNLPFISDATMSEGFDDKGQYISLYDVWDYNTNVIRTPGDNVGKHVGGKPFEIYQRYYLDDWFDVPEEERGYPYIAPAYN